MNLQEFSDVCEKNYKNYKSNLWLEDNETDMLAYFFQFEYIFKEFLKSVVNDKKNKRNKTKLSDKKIDSLVFKEYHFPKVRVKTTEINEKKEMDLLIEGKNFICVIENKMSAKQSIKNKRSQCQYYKEEVEKLCKKGNKTPICIYLDNEHSSNSIQADDFYNSKYFEGFYLAYQGENVLLTLQNLDKNKVKESVRQELEDFCCFLSQATLKKDDKLQLDINNQRKRIENILGQRVSYDRLKDDLYIDGMRFDTHEYLKLLCITSIMEEKDIKLFDFKTWKNEYKYSNDLK